MRLTAPARPAARYAPADDLCILTAYFNPLGYGTRRRNYEVFRRAMRAGGLRLVTAECAFGAAPFQLPSSPDLIRVRARDVMWEKERLLNLALERLPARCTKVAWVDCDVLFENPRWAVLTSQLLERHAVVQPFARPIRLLRDGSAWEDERWTRGFAAVYAVDRHAVRSGDRVRHGDPGLAWAARLDALWPRGLYDCSIAGGADHLMAHAMCGDLESACLDRLLGVATPQRVHAEEWGRRFGAVVAGDIAHVPGAAFHLWHGDYARRTYRARHEELRALGFDPATDLRLGDQGCWEWATAKPELHRWVREYFGRRQEDGPEAPPPRD